MTSSAPSVLCLPTLLLVIGSMACSSPRYRLDEDGLARFEQAGPIVPEIDRDALLNSLPAPGPYRLVRGDLLRIHAPRVFFEESAEDAGAGGPHVPYSVRVTSNGEISLPLIGVQAVAGLTLPEMEEKIAAAAFPKYLTSLPGIVARIEEYKRVTISIMGEVEDPGLHHLRSDQLSLFGALTEAGGIARSGNNSAGARYIRITREGHEDGSEVIVLPVTGLSLPLSDVRLSGGERIEVERYEPKTFTVVGLVTKPGAYEYPLGVSYNLMQALAIAGGIDRIANPPYATIFRRDALGNILPATIAIDGDDLTVASSLEIKPGDVIAVQHTAVTWTRSFAAAVFRINIGWFTDLND